ncbi:tRNA dihydrouridine(16) synthase DusC [Halioglobus maricola]|uniref:tRNA-dihydrouridine(16) synthase n=1 Tax=Halioglobus maricola TaxID=2601894 RepID=A0A5P9NID8_9GAMM|nr:tRNA-dihydrouridine synthase [Halioglobus maricola]QFU75309.1 tRNA dihydrouridine(16) synthase DusC [Halioglobus maricola]
MRLMIAPMEGVVDHTMRTLLTSVSKVDRCVTEFVRVNDQLLPPRVFHRYCPELKQGGVTPSGVPVFVQILGGDPQVVAENAARAAELGAAGIDLNFGCPAKTVNNSNGGSILLRNPEHVAAIASAARAAVPSSVPVTVKTRLGYEDGALFEDIVRGIGETGADELTVHARTKRHGYRPPAYWEEIAIARELLDIPVIANGEIWSPDDARRCREVSGCEDLMLGRGALCRPDLPDLIRADDMAEDRAPLRWEEVLLLVQTYLEATIDAYDAHCVGNPIKQWLVYLRSYYPQAAILFENIKRLRDPEALRAQLAAEVKAAPAVGRSVA